MLNRARIEHILRAAGEVTGHKRFVLIGSAAIAAWREIIPDEMATSRDVDLFAIDAPDPERLSEDLDGSLGQASQFDQTHGYYCDGVGPETATMPSDWPSRAKTFQNANTNGVAALVPDPNDIALSKLCAWRPKDITWLRAAKGHGVIDADVMRMRISLMPDKTGDRAELASRIMAL